MTKTTELTERELLDRLDHRQRGIYQDQLRRGHLVEARHDGKTGALRLTWDDGRKHDVRALRHHAPRARRLTQLAVLAGLAVLAATALPLDFSGVDGPSRLLAWGVIAGLVCGVMSGWPKVRDQGHHGLMAVVVGAAALFELRELLESHDGEETRPTTR